MEYETKFEKTGSGWTGTTEIIIGEVPADSLGGAGNRVLQISTGKWENGRGIYTHASVFERRDSGRGYHTKVFDICQDFSKSLVKTPNVRVTEKSVKEHHVKALVAFPLIEEDAIAFYANKSSAA